MSKPNSSAEGTVKIRVVWLVGILATAGGMGATGLCLKLIYSDKLAEITAITNERDHLRELNTKLNSSMAQLIDRSVLDQCEAQLEKVRGNKNEQVHAELMDLEKQHNDDVQTLRDLSNRKWNNPYHQLIEADEITRETAEQRWSKYPDDKDLLLKQLVCVP
jgi:hypothetical protein